MHKKKLLFFRWRYSDLCADFVLKNKLLTEQCLEPFFDVVSTSEDCDYSEMVDLHEPDLVMFESGSGTLPFWRPKITNTRAHPEIPRIGFLESDPHSGSRSVFMADMDRLGIDMFFSRMNPMGEYFPEIADRLFLFPWHADVSVCKDWGLGKNIVLNLTGACSPPYPWRMKMFPVLSESFPALRSVHGGYLRSQATTMQWGEGYSRQLNASNFSATDGTGWRLLVKKHLEITASRCCLVAEDTPILAAAGFRDMENCVLGDDRDVPDKMNELLTDPERLEQITTAGYDLVHRRHLAEHRPQLRQWLDLVTEHGMGADLVQDGPFGDVTLAEGNKKATPHLKNFCEDRLYLGRGREALRAGEHHSAAIMFTKMLDMAWHMAEGNLGMAQCDLLAGRPDLAQDRLRITLKWCMKQYKCHAPNPVEWGWYIVTMLCHGKRVKAAHMADQFGPGKATELKHKDYAYARILVRVLAGEPVPDEPVVNDQIPCIHASVYKTLPAFLDAAAQMLNACKRPSEADTIRHALKTANRS